MSKHRTEDGKILDTEKAKQNWDEATCWNGSNSIGRSTNSQWHDQTLYKSAKGRYYTVTVSRVDGESDHAEILQPEDAAKWLLLNDYDLPEDLAKLEEEIAE
jgi:hypothetical protein